jgi:SAM-dependent methyltransferase
MDVAGHNLRSYRSALQTWHYARSVRLLRCEEVLFDRLADEFKGKRILDIGVGGGRTTPFLRLISKNYMGIDYSPEMIARCRLRFPDVNFRVYDARKLGLMPVGSFDLVVFSFNGIDYMGHENRLTVLKGVRRILAPGGAFLFASHNRRAPIIEPWSLGNLPLDVNPLRDPKDFLSRLAQYPLGIMNAARVRKHRRYYAEYELRNDQGNQYALITYYIHYQDQVFQLTEQIGFTSVEGFDFAGALITPERSFENQEPWIYYLCRDGGS